jgi:hypothetical protein
MNMWDFADDQYEAVLLFKKRPACPPTSDAFFFLCDDGTSAVVGGQVRDLEINNNSKNAC